MYLYVSGMHPLYKELIYMYTYVFQARTHQLLVHNKELLDHITALVSHLQEQERIQAHQQQHVSQHVTSVPQVSLCVNFYLKKT